MPTPPLAKRLSVVQPSATVAISQRAAELRAQGIDVLSFGVGEPDFDTPVHIREATKKALDAGMTRYTAVRGTVELRKAICADSKRRRGVAHEPSEVIVSVGAKHSLFNLAMALLDPGDEVIIPAPYWVSYPEQVRMVDANPVIVPTTEAEGFRLSPDKLSAAITPRTKMLQLCSPSNPTGAAYEESHLRALVDVARKHSFWIVVDEIYAQLVYGGFKQRSILEIAPDLKERIIVVDGVSKTYAMTGFRIGWILANKQVAEACDTIQGQSTTNPTAIAQAAAIAALEGPQDEVEKMRAAFERRRDLIVRGLDAIPGIRCRMPEGAFYAFASVEGLVGKRDGDRVLEDDVAVSAFFLEKARCAVVPGTPFGAPGYVRLSYATSDRAIESGLARIREAIATLG